MILVRSFFMLINLFVDGQLFYQTFCRVRGSREFRYEYSLLIVESFYCYYLKDYIILVYEVYNIPLLIVLHDYDQRHDEIFFWKSLLKLEPHKEWLLCRKKTK